MKGGQTTYDVVLEEDSQTLDDVVVTGIYERKRSDFTGSASTFTADKLKEVGNQNILQSLKSLDPAFAIMESNEWGFRPEPPAGHRNPRQDEHHRDAGGAGGGQH